MYSVDIQEQHIAGEDTNQNIDRTGRDDLHSQGYYGQNTICAVIDTGIVNHEEFEDRIIAGKNFTKDFNDANNYTDIHGHGTHCSGTVLGKNVGVAPQAKLLVAKVLGGSDGLGYNSDIAKGIIWAVDNGADVISMSLGGETYSKEIHDAEKYAESKNVLIVKAAGNTGTEVNHYPGASPEGITVAASDENMYRADFSTINKVTDVTQDGVKVLSCGLNNDYVYMTGTSMATPKVAGIALLMISKLKAQGIEYDVNFLKKLLIFHCRDRGSKGHDKYYGYGYCAIRHNQKELTITQDSDCLNIKIGEPEISKKMRGKARLIDDMFYIPFREPLEELGLDVEYWRNDKGQIVARGKA